MHTKAPPPYLRDTTGSDAELYDETHKRNLTGVKAAIANIDSGNVANVLFIGPGNGHFDLLPFLQACPTSRVVAVEPSDAMREQLQAELKKHGYLERVVLVAKDIDDALQSGFESSSSETQFNGIVACSVLHHLPNWRMTLHWLIHKHLKPNGWLLVDEWMPGSPLYSIDCNGSHDSEATIRYVFADRESKTGIMWDPELRGHDVSALVAFLQSSGFVGVSNDSKPPTRKWDLDLREPFVNGTHFAICRWGTGSRHAAYCAQFLTAKTSLPVHEQIAALRFWLFTMPNACKCSQAGLGYALQPVHLSRILSHLTTKLEPHFGADHAELRQIQVLQIAIHYCAFWAGTKWCIPIRAEIDPETTLLKKETAPIRAFLFRDGCAATDVITRTLMNMWRLFNKVKIGSGSITTELLNLIQEEDGFSNMQEAVIELRLAENIETVTHERNGDVEFRRVVLKPIIPFATASNDLAITVKNWVDNNVRYRFGDFLLLDLKQAYDDLSSALNKELQGTSFSTKLPSQVGDSVCDRRLIELLRGFVPMIRAGEVLRLVFSPLGKQMDAAKHRIEPLIFGAFLLLEQETPEGELRDLDAPRLARIQAFNRLVQLDIASQQHRLSEDKRLTDLVRAEAYKKSHLMLERLQAPLRELTSSLEVVQNRAQNLRSIIYEPSEGLFASYPLIMDLFDDQRPLKLSTKVQVLLAHELRFDGELQNDTVPPNERRKKKCPLDGRVVWAEALCRIFPIEKSKRGHAKTRLEFLKIAKKELEQTSENELWEPIKFLCNPNGAAALTLTQLLNVLPPTECLQKLKKCCFDPFKLHVDKEGWKMLAIALALRRFGLPYKENFATDKLNVQPDWTPIRYCSVLSFLLKISSAIRSRNQLEEVVTSIEVTQTNYSTILNVYFGDNVILHNQHPGGLKKLQEIIRNHILQLPRDWRIEASTVGNFQQPFFELASSIIGLVDAIESNSSGTKWTADPAGVSGLKSEASLHEVFKVISATRLFVVEAGDDYRNIGIRLSWIPRS